MESSMGSGSSTTRDPFTVRPSIVVATKIENTPLTYTQILVAVEVVNNIADDEV